MNKSVSKPLLKRWKDNLGETTDIPVLTTNALVSLEDLETFVQTIKAKNADSVRINLVRFDWKENEPQTKKEDGPDFPLGCRWIVADGTGKTQVAIAMNGAKGFHQNADYTDEAEDLVENGEVLMLIPGDLPEGPTGHNPPTR